MELDGLKTMRRMAGVCAVAFGLLAATAAASPQGASAARSSALFGSSRIGSHADSIVAGSARAFPFINHVSGSTRTIRLYVAGHHRAHAFTIGIYSSSAGRPASLLAAGSASFPRAGAWAAVDVRAVALRAGRTY